MINTGQHIDRLISDNPCRKHNKMAGEPCWDLSQGSHPNLRAVCGKRIRLGGFNGKISTTSLALKKLSNKKEVSA